MRGVRGVMYGAGEALEQRTLVLDAGAGGHVVEVETVDDSIFLTARNDDAVGADVRLAGSYLLIATDREQSVDLEHGFFGAFAIGGDPSEEGLEMTYASPAGVRACGRCLAIAEPEMPGTRTFSIQGARAIEEGWIVAAGVDAPLPVVTSS